MITLAIGDVHGELTKLKQLIAVARDKAPRISKVVFIGDYIDRGEDSKGVIDYVRSLPNAIALKGNHEDMLVHAYRGQDYQQYQWDHAYGHITCQSFGVANCWDIPVEYIRWMEDLPYFHNDGLRTFVHAGIQRGVSLSMTAQSKEYMIWARNEFLLDTDPAGGFVVHGHTPRVDKCPDLYPNRVNIDNGAVFGASLCGVLFDDIQDTPTHAIWSDGRFFPF
jgi:serine/threonine protein phosphatase 1